MENDRYSKAAFWRHIERWAAHSAWACLEKLVQNPKKYKVSKQELEDMKSAATELEKEMGRTKEFKGMEERSVSTGQIKGFRVSSFGDTP